jgi:undecaprenyl-diphosphatase
MEPVTNPPSPEQIEPTPTGRLARLDALDRRITARILISQNVDGTVRRGVNVLRRFSETGSYGAGWVILFALVGFLRAGLWQAVASSLFVLGMLTANTLIKNVFKRPRPTLRAIKHAPSSWSMPSAHTSMAMVGAATMSVMVPELAILWWCVAIGLGLSRVMLGMHFFGDVLAGAVLGAVVGLAIAAPVVSAL